MDHNKILKLYHDISKAKELIFKSTRPELIGLKSDNINPNYEDHILFDLKQIENIIQIYHSRINNNIMYFDLNRFFNDLIYIKSFDQNLITTKINIKTNKEYDDVDIMFKPINMYPNGVNIRVFLDLQRRLSTNSFYVNSKPIHFSNIPIIQDFMDSILTYLFETYHPQLSTIYQKVNE